MNETAMLFELQQVDLNMVALQRRLLEVEALLGETLALRDARQQVERARERARTWHTRLTELELNLESLSEKIETGEKRLYSGRVRNPKELESLQMETVSLKNRLRAIEEEALQAMERVDETRAALTRAEQHWREVEREWKETQKALAAERKELMRRLNTLTSERRERIATLSPRALSAYDHLRKQKGGHAVALLKGGVCQGCRVSVSANKVREVHAGSSLVFCGNCDRILYAAE
jgi:hypothetical protein